MRALLVGPMSLLFVTAALCAEPSGRGDAAKDMTNCPPGATTGAAPSKGASEDAQAVEKSAILPSAEAHDKSAAPTVQRNGQSVEVRTDCPQDADQPKPK